MNQHTMQGTNRCGGMAGSDSICTGPMMTYCVPDGAMVAKTGRI